jgi:uncharacterized protein (DUF924 family)
MNALARELLTTWFGDDEAAIGSHAPKWFRRDPAFDDLLRARFEAHVTRAAAGAFRDWEATPEGALALVLLLDQIPRNVYRDDPRAFAWDAAALAVARRALAKGFEKGLIPPKRAFVLMPLMHSEETSVHAESLAAQEALAASARGGPWADMSATGLDFARRHAVIVWRFGRYPHRNAALGRTSTDEETAFLREPGSGF